MIPSRPAPHHGEASANCARPVSVKRRHLDNAARRARPRRRMNRALSRCTFERRRRAAVAVEAAHQGTDGSLPRLRAAHAAAFAMLLDLDRTVKAASDEQFSMAPPRLQSDARASPEEPSASKIARASSSSDGRFMGDRKPFFVCGSGLRCCAVLRATPDGASCASVRRAVVRSIAREAPR